jgi:hypothetical protein
LTSAVLAALASWAAWPSIQRHAPARAPVTLEFLRGYPAAQLEMVRQFTDDLAAAPAPAEPRSNF